MRTLMLSLLLLPGLLIGCAFETEEPEDDDIAFGGGEQDLGGDVPPPGPDDAQEAVYYNNDQCHIVFRNLSSPEAETFFIWNLGVNGVLQEEPYPTLLRPDLYAVFAPAPPDATHHVDGHDDFDHYHIVSVSPDRLRYDGTWDVFLVFPGPNFDPATYQVAKSVLKMKKQIHDGILGPITPTPDAGFDPLVLNAEIHDECD
jgi:hypothetical protein